MEEKIKKALKFISNYGGIDGAHHKQWTLDQIARILAGDGYDAWVVSICNGENGPNTYDLNTGIAP